MKRNKVLYPQIKNKLKYININTEKISEISFKINKLL